MAESTKYPRGIQPDGAGYRIKLYKDGKLILSKTIKGTTKAALAAAIKERNRLKARLDAGLPIHSEQKTELKMFADMASEYLETLDLPTDTIKEYHKILDGWWMVFDGLPVQEITATMVKQELALMNVSPKTKKNRLIPLRGIFNQAGVEPPKIKVAKAQKARIPRYRPEQRDKLLGWLAAHWDQAFVYFSILFHCGLRPGEALALKWTDFDGEYLFVEKQITRRKHKDTVKNYKWRKVYVPTCIRERISSLATREQDSYLFLNTVGGPHLDTDQFNDAWREAHKACGLPYRLPYVCRHTRAAELLSQGVIPARAAKELGHSIQMFLDIYSEFIEEYANTDLSQLESSSAVKTAEKQPSLKLVNS